MIRINLPERPAFLTDELIETLSKEYEETENDVWNTKPIREAVLKISSGKCCYTECKLQEESKYMEVDHFFPRKHFPEKVMEWGNLVPACKRANASKGELNTLLEPIVNPLIDNPKDHLYIRNFRFYPKTAIGRTTIDAVSLNNRNHFVNKRYSIGTKVSEILDDIYLELSEHLETIRTRHLKRNRLLEKYKNLLLEGTRENEYSATLSTVILSDLNNGLIETLLKDNLFWDNELNEIKAELEFCALIE